ncbi:MAG: DNA translocase FtsK [Planctomycetota bacterium]|nr:DNA translocase FtsK [Planctomycetota bacterium]
MAKSRSKPGARKVRGGVLAEQAGFVGAGLHAVLGWIGSALLSLWSALVWAARWAWVAVEGKRGRTPVGFALAAVSLFAVVALLDFEQGSENVCGIVGRNVAEWLLVFFGLGAFVPAAFGAFWGLARIFREESSGRALPKLVGTAVLAVSVALLGHTIGDAAPSNPYPEGHGGLIGATVVPPLAEGLGPVGLALLLSMLTLVSLVLATEWAFVPLVREMLRRGAAQIRQQDLPFQGGGRSAREEQQAEGERARGFLARITGAVRGLFGSFESTDGEAAVASAATAAAPAPARPRAKPLRVSVDGKSLGKAKPPEDEEESSAVDELEQQELDEEQAPDLLNLPGITPGPEVRTARMEVEEQERRRQPRRKPRLDSLPPVSILVAGERRTTTDQREEIGKLGAKLQSVFQAFGIDGAVIGAERGPTLTMFEVQLGTGVSVKRLKSQLDDLGVALGTHGVRIVYPLPGRSTVGIEVPNLKRDGVRLKDVFDEAVLDWEGNKLPMVVGRDTLGKPTVEDLAEMPHMLIAGATGSGKSVCLNSILITMLMTRTPDQVRMVLVDPKQVELQIYADIPHLLCPVVTEMKRAPFVLEWAVKQMEDRLHQFKTVGVRKISEYNDLGVKGLQEILGEEYDSEEFPESLPYFVMVIDELADLMLTSRKEVETAIARLAAKARAAGIHLIVATQRPSADVVTGLIKTNLPVRMAFRVTSGIDSRVILDESGAETLLGNGDFLYRPPGSAGLVRGQGAFVSTKEVREVCEHLRKHGKPEFLEDLVQMKSGGSGLGDVDDPLYEDAVRVILQSGRGSASLIQRALAIGYTRASRLIDIMTEQGVLGPFVGSKAREVMLTMEQWEEQNSSRQKQVQ